MSPNPRKEAHIYRQELRLGFTRACLGEKERWGELLIG